MKREIRAENWFDSAEECAIGLTECAIRPTECAIRPTECAIGPAVGFVKLLENVKFFAN